MLRSWGDVVGETVSRHCWPVRISRGNLLVAVDSSVWMAELSYYKERIIEQFNAKQGCSLRGLQFRLGKRECPDKLESPITVSAAPLLTGAEVEWASALAQRVGDEKLREVLRRVLMEHKRHQKNHKGGH